MVYEEWRDESEEKERDGRGGEKSLRKSEEASEQGGGRGKISTFPEGKIQSLCSQFFWKNKSERKILKLKLKRIYLQTRRKNLGTY